jgi:hypothetical protein
MLTRSQKPAKTKKSEIRFSLIDLACHLFLLGMGRKNPCGVQTEPVTILGKSHQTNKQDDDDE